MIDFDSLVQKSCMQVFGEPATYTMMSDVIQTTFDITVILDDSYVGVDAGGMQMITTKPVAGIRLSEFPPAYDPESAQGDSIKITSTGKIYDVKDGQKDSKGGAVLHLNRIARWET